MLFVPIQDCIWNCGCGIASALTSRPAREILARGKVPFYCSAWSNIRSVRNAVKSGFIPTWVEVTVKPASIVEEMNKTNYEKETNDRK